MKKIILTILLLSWFISPLVAAATETRTFDLPLQEAFIKYQRLDWQTYEFWVVSNLTKPESLSYEWTVDKAESFTVPVLRYFFRRGEHEIKVKVEDQYGNLKYDHVILKVSFWSLQNNWFWWVVYCLVVLIIFYYWIIKLLYLFNRRQVSKQVRQFLDILDEHGWVERLVAEHLKKHAIKTTAKSTSKKAKLNT